MAVSGRRPAELLSHKKSGAGAVEAEEVLMAAGDQSKRQSVGLHAAPDL